VLLLQAEFTENVIASVMNTVSEQTAADCKGKKYFGMNGSAAGREGVGWGGSAVEPRVNWWVGVSIVYFVVIVR